MSKTMKIYSDLDTRQKRIINKLIMSIFDKSIDTDELSRINKLINRSRRRQIAPSKFTTGYMIFYKERFPFLYNNNNPVTKPEKQLESNGKNLPRRKKRFTGNRH